ncbi:acyl-CoA dehydrogenase [Paenibacillus sp. J2TS4]|uniref:acyl-CoA dehydrogenase n=1 Tax=Paenibacillus sp. J2TS4 TaxID=2807194 RepID=UPI001B280565|nr:acyl-CoA dehydrogenase [Paenibacillus sp. J2TS4]GIP33273.1 hydroxylase [Paenibacillus sp. J2TS4]
MLSSEQVYTIRERATEWDKAAVFPSEMLEIIYDQQLFKLFVPNALGGRMTPLPEALRSFEQCSWADGSFGWLVTIGAGGGFFVPFMSAPACTLYSDRKAVVAGSGFPSGTAERVDGGYRVSGSWKYCSGSTHATMFTANCFIAGDSASSEKEMRSFIFLPEQVKIVRDWTAFGLRATESHTITVDQVFVPDEMTFDLTGNPNLYNDPIYSYPFLLFAQSSFAAVAVGIAKHLIEEAGRVAEGNREAWEPSGRYLFIRNKIGKVEEQWRRSVDEFYSGIEESWNKHVSGFLLSEDHQQEISRLCKATASMALSCGQALFPYMGIRSVMEEAPINRIWRDLQTACQHTLLISFEEVE